MIADDVVVTGSLRLEARDIVAGRRAVMWRTWLVGGLCMVAGTAFALWQSRGAPAFVLAPALILALFCYVVWRAVRAGGDRALANLADEECNLVYRLDREGVAIESGAGMWQFNWPGIHRFREGRETFVLFTTEAFAHFVPKRALAADQISVVRDMLAERIRPRRRSVALVLGFTPKRAIRGLTLWVLLVLMFLAIWQLLQPAGGR
jgi:hypothetical protein